VTPVSLHGFWSRLGKYHAQETILKRFFFFRENAVFRITFQNIHEGKRYFGS